MSEETQSQQDHLTNHYVNKPTCNARPLIEIPPASAYLHGKQSAIDQTQVAPAKNTEAEGSTGMRNQAVATASKMVPKRGIEPPTY